MLIPQRIYALQLDPVPGERTLKNFLVISIKPVQQTMYTWDGEWNAKDTGSGVGSTIIYLLPKWKEFYLQQNENSKFSEEISEVTGGFIDINNGLDCSGFVGWTLYNVFNTENFKEGYAMAL